jgi:hypothetical protein
LMTSMVEPALWFVTEVPKHSSLEEEESR